jgi:hypothetical protein
MDYAGAVITERGRCFRFVCNEHGKPDLCREPLAATGWLKIGPRWCQVDAWAEHSIQLRQLVVTRGSQSD